MSNWNTNIPQIVDGTTQVNADSINSVVTVLAGREQFLFDQLNSYSDKTILLSYNQPLSTNLVAGTPVYFYTGSGNTPVLHPAKSGFAQNTNPAHLAPQASAYVFGIIKSSYTVSGDATNYGDVYVYGLASGISFKHLLDTASYTGNEPQPGPLYLSSREAGKYSTTPGGASIFVGYIVSSDPTNLCSIFVAPNIDSLNQLYFNYTLTVEPVTAGVPSKSGSTWSINSANTEQLGWIQASDVSSLGITVPTIVVSGTSYSPAFYYNIPAVSLLTTENGFTNDQITNCLHFKEALPPYPGAYSMFFVNGVLQPAESTSQANGVYYINSDGLWWMNSADGYQPFDHDSDGNPLSNSPLEMRLLITKLNPNLKESIVTSLNSSSGAVAVVDALTGVPSATGDLNLTLTPSFSIVSSGSTGTAVQSVGFDSINQVFVLGSSPVINTLTAGPGVTVTSTNGDAVVSLSSALGGEVTDIEPEEADYVYRGLHSYLRLRKPVVNQRIGFVGKLQLPNNIPTGSSVVISLLAFGETTGSNIIESATFAFEYSVSAAGAPVSINVASTTPTIPAGYFQGYNAAKVYRDTGGNAFFQVPNSVLTAGGYLNFRIARTNTNGSGNNVPIGILGVNWSIE